MAERRMFAKTIIDSDSFLDMPLSTQSLYFHLSMRADDDGFLNNAKKIQRIIGAAQNDYDLLVAKKFIIQFPDGICVIKHWRMHNYIQKDRYKETVYKDEKAMLEVKKNGSYTVLDTECIQDVYGLEAQVRLGKDSIGKDSKNIVQDSCTLFEKLWKVYPNKKGKGRVSQSQKTALLKIGEAELYRAIERYKLELEKDDWRKPQNGSTFFNSGYIDYLDVNFVPSKSKPGRKTKNLFNDGCEKTDYDMSELERGLLR